RPAEGYRSESLQPMIYALAAETLVGAEVESSRLAYCTERERFSSDYTVPGPRARKRLSRILEHIDAQLGEGWLPAAPRKGACKFCDYRPICGTDEERRNTRKTPDAKASLPTEEDSA
ncbi:MAG: PD-(D/E)XK nuclease family protein, partial [Myxococcota bacterium]